jgi:hypothetical protein
MEEGEVFREVSDSEYADSSEEMTVEATKLKVGRVVGLLVEEGHGGISVREGNDMLIYKKRNAGVQYDFRCKGKETGMQSDMCGMKNVDVQYEKVKKCDLAIQCNMSCPDVEEELRVAAARRIVPSKGDRWTYKEKKVLWEVYEWSKPDGTSGANDRMYEEWVRRGLREASKETLQAHMSKVQCGDLSPLWREHIRKEVRERRERETRNSVTRVANDPVVEVETVSEDRRIVDEQENEVLEVVGVYEQEPMRDEQGVREALAEEAGVSVEARSTDFWKDGSDERMELDEEMRMVLKRIREVYMNEEIVQVPSLKARERRMVNKEVRLVNGVIHNVGAKSVTEINKVLYAGSFVVAERLGLMKERNVLRNRKNEPWWKRRIEKSIVKWKADLSRTEEVLRGVNVRRQVRDRLDTLYQLNARGALGVSVFLRSKIQAGSTKGTLLGVPAA